MRDEEGILRGWRGMGTEGGKIEGNETHVGVTGRKKGTSKREAGEMEGTVEEDD